MNIFPDISILKEQKVMVIVRHHSTFDIARLVSSVCDAEINFLEITLNTPDAYNLIRIAVKQFENRMLIGAGTVLTVEEAKKAIDCGAGFIVSPVLDLEIMEFCSDGAIPVFPGAATPTEAYNAHKAGANMVKLFPASTFGPSYIKALKAPLNDLKILAVGGIDKKNIKEYFANGADAVAVGAGIIKPEYIDTNNFGAIKKELIDLKKVIVDLKI